ncbi:AAA family ATPase [Propionivibrio sp.]|uniref:AAA family ATPase n=1 Tax=Propionivibrio sp. TaxID=2212460 RepID=UPI003BF276FA
MKHSFVKNENYRRFATAYAALENRGAPERCILAEIGKPGAGKTRIVDNFGSSADAVFLEGIPGMSLRYVKDALKAETGIKAKGGYEEFALMVEFFSNNGKPLPIILDECQHGFSNKAECVEYLRRLAEKAGSILVLVCHTSEAHLFNRYEHIKTRIGCVCEILQPSLADTTLYCDELCEVRLEADLIAEVHRQSGARYRLISDALATLERLAAKLGQASLSLADVAGMPLCDDCEKTLKNKQSAKGGK